MKPTEESGFQKTETQKSKVVELKTELSQLRERDREWKFMFNTLAHDLKEPIVTLEGFTKLLEDSKPLSPEQTRYVQVLKEAVDSLQFMIASLQSIPKLYQKPRNINRVSLNQTIGSVASALSEKMKQTRGEILFPEEDLEIMSDPLPLYHIFLNLISNSLKFHRKGVKPIIQLRYEREDKQSVISIADNGVGIDEKDLQRIFDPYSRVDEAVTDGLGLGLSIIKRIVESLGGKITVESIRNQGTIFRVCLPDQPEKFNNSEVRPS